MDRNDDDNTNKYQKWTRKVVDEVEDWFIWSNKAKDEAGQADDNLRNKFLAAPDNTVLNMQGIRFSIH